MNALAKPAQAITLMKAFNNACSILGVNKAEQSKIIGVNASTLARNNQKGFRPESKEGELQLSFIRLYRSLFAIAGGDNNFMKHWFRTENKALHGAPAILCQRVQGLVMTNMYLDAMRGKI